MFTIVKWGKWVPAIARDLCASHSADFWDDPYQVCRPAAAMARDPRHRPYEKANRKCSRCYSIGEDGREPALDSLSAQNSLPRGGAHA
jgi:hypothetical protein